MINEKLLTSKVRSWYMDTFPSDDLGEEIRTNINFLDVIKTLERYEIEDVPYRDVYNCLGVDDSIIRERVFEKLTEILDLEYDDIYYKWLHPYNYAKNMAFDDTVLPYIFGDIKLTESSSNNFTIIDTFAEYENYKEEDYEDIMSEVIEQFFDEMDYLDKRLPYTWYAIEGQVGRWNGRYKILPTFKESLVEAIETCLKDGTDFEVYVQDGDLFVTSYHHDGKNTFTIKGIDDKALYSLDDINYELEEDTLELISIGEDFLDWQN